MVDLQGSRDVILAIDQPKLLSKKFTPLQIVEQLDGIDLKTFATGIILDLRTNPLLEGGNDTDIKTCAKWIKESFQTSIYLFQMQRGSSKNLGRRWLSSKKKIKLLSTKTL